jgi:hypothetical protein
MPNPASLEHSHASPGCNGDNPRASQNPVRPGSDLPISALPEPRSLNPQPPQNHHTDLACITSSAFPLWPRSCWGSLHSPQPTRAYRAHAAADSCSVVILLRIEALKTSPKSPATISRQLISMPLFSMMYAYENNYPVGVTLCPSKQN